MYQGQVGKRLQNVNDSMLCYTFTKGGIHQTLPEKQSLCVIFNALKSCK